ncbi:hypothetical protein LCGC14_2045010 [marine sediment metagenome]|uniref:Uncharacterized protein n=1 Tax=marine sediment metagenome TaxID=412755 RepID=A0A0F9H441_9ZZZZ
MSDKRVEILATLKAKQEAVTPFDIIREVFNLGWQIQSEDLVLQKLDEIEAKLTRQEEALRKIAEKENDPWYSADDLTWIARQALEADAGEVS